MDAALVHVFGICVGNRARFAGRGSQRSSSWRSHGRESSWSVVELPEQKADEHDPSGDLTAILRAAKQSPDEQKWVELRQQLREFINEEPAKQLEPPPSLARGNFELDNMPGMVRRNRAAAFAPYSDYSPMSAENLKL